MRVRLYTTAGCHLCEQAMALLALARGDGFAFDICEVEISESESLMEIYGVRIPVLALDGRSDELGWPFTYDDLLAFIPRKTETLC